MGMTFGEMLNVLLKRTGVTKSELAEKVGVSKQSITEITKGRTKEPAFSTAVAMAEVLGVSLTEMVEMMRDE
jgi:DNA-binding XRE family transcriptional regulator